MSLTRFLPLWHPPKRLKVGPVTAVLHASHGNCIGPHAPYEWHVLGGPHSSRAYTIGELGAARNWLEAAAEIRAPIPIKYLNKIQAYAFAEDARSFDEIDMLPGRPREYFKRPGQGKSTGVGLKTGAVRFEWARDCNKGSGTWYMFFGDRF